MTKMSNPERSRPMVRRHNRIEPQFERQKADYIRRRCGNSEEGRALGAWGSKSQRSSTGVKSRTERATVERRTDRSLVHGDGWVKETRHVSPSPQQKNVDLVPELDEEFGQPLQTSSERIVDRVMQEEKSHLEAA